MDSPEQSKQPPTQISTALRRAATSAAVVLRKEYGSDLDRATSDRVGRLVAALLRPRSQPGRRRTDAVRIALELRGQGKLWREIYVKAIPGFHALNYFEQRHRADNLRRAVREARKGAKEKPLVKKL